MAVLDLFRLTGRCALVTGGSRGLGRVMAQAFAEAGADLVLVGRTPDTLQQARDELSAQGIRVEILTADLSTGEGAEELCDRIVTSGRAIDVLVNNIGGRREDTAIQDMTLADWRRLLDLNLASAMVCTRRLGQAMRERRWGRIVNIASIAGQVAFRDIGGRHYETAKAALVGFTRAVAADWAPDGVTVNAIAPGAFLTDPNRKWFAERPHYRSAIESRIPLGRLGDPAEIGPLALYLASDASRYMTGQVLVIDGGYTLW
jgi:NAD(P)-dependent dehydrogenase (short-subunit alcohol dehydrogenase family)